MGHELLPSFCCNMWVELAGRLSRDGRWCGRTREPKYVFTIEFFQRNSLEFFHRNSWLVFTSCLQKYLHCKYFYNHVAHLYSQHICGSICSYFIRNIPRVLRGSKNSYLVSLLRVLCYYCTFSLLHLMH